MAELVIAALMTAVVTYGMSATAKLRNGRSADGGSAGVDRTAEVERADLGVL
jgi:hypothetical protein